MPLQFRDMEGTTRTKDPLSNPFTDIFQTAISAVKETEQEEADLEYLMATGQLDNPVPLVLAANKASISVNLLMQLRSRAMEAYNELIRMNL